MHVNEQAPVTDSPWFWLLIFSLVALGALVAISGKYGRRQTVIERNYQARERVAERLAAESDRNEPQPTDNRAQRDLASAEDRLIPLWPLAAILILVAIFAGAMLYRGDQGRGRPGSHDEVSAPP